MNSDVPADRIRATAVLARHVLGNPTEADLRRLIDRLEDTDPVVRLHAITALAQVAGDRKGYQPWDPLAERHRAVQGWRLWYADPLRKRYDPGS